VEGKKVLILGATNTLNKFHIKGRGGKGGDEIQKKTRRSTYLLTSHQTNDAKKKPWAQGSIPLPGAKKNRYCESGKTERFSHNRADGGETDLRREKWLTLGQEGWRPPIHSSLSLISMLTGGDGLGLADAKEWVHNDWWFGLTGFSFDAFFPGSAKMQY